MNKKKALGIVLMLIIICTFLIGCGSSPQDSLEGSWALNWFSSSSTYLAGDLVFGEAKSLALTDALTGANQNLRYAVIGP